MVWVLIVLVTLFLIVFEDELHVLEFLSEVYVWMFYILLVASIVFVIIAGCKEKRLKEVESTRVIVDSVESPA